MSGAKFCGDIQVLYDKYLAQTRVGVGSILFKSSIFRKPNLKQQYCQTVKYLCRLNRTTSVILQHWRKLHVEQRYKSYFWKRKLKRYLSEVYGNMGTQFNEDHPSCPNEVITSEMIEKIHEIVINNRRGKRSTRDCWTVVISIERMQNILTIHLDIKKLPVRQ